MLTPLPKPTPPDVKTLSDEQILQFLGEVFPVARVQEMWTEGEGRGTRCVDDEGRPLFAMHVRTARNAYGKRFEAYHHDKRQMLEGLYALGLQHAAGEALAA